MKKGDINSRFFHRAIKKKKMTNGMAGLVVEGEWVEDPVRVKIAIKEFFQRQFKKKNG